MNKSEQINELATALAKAQGELENASKSSNNPHFKSKYADLAEIINTTRPVFSSHGLSVTQCPSFEAGVVSVETILMHSSGQWMSSTISAPVSKQDAQGVGSAITYCRRYALAAVAGIAQEDDDANSAVGHGTKKAPNLKEVGESVITAKQVAEVRQALELVGVAEGLLLQKAQIESVETMPAVKFSQSMNWINRHADQGAA